MSTDDYLVLAKTKKCKGLISLTHILFNLVSNEIIVLSLENVINMTRFFANLYYYENTKKKEITF